eukprot:5503092-Pleurochrysis_carterae.AAC.1
MILYLPSSRLFSPLASLPQSVTACAWLHAHTLVCAASFTHSSAPPPPHAVLWRRAQSAFRSDASRDDDEDDEDDEPGHSSEYLE